MGVSRKAIRDTAKAILSDLGGYTALELVDVQAKNHILRAETPNHGAVCVKICKHAIASEAGRRKQACPSNEVRAYDHIRARHNWAPRLIAASPDSCWLVRAWCDGPTIDKLPRDGWTPDMLGGLYEMFGALLAAFHTADIPSIVQDIKPQNVSYDGAAFSFFDFGAVTPLGAARSAEMPIRLGSGNFRYRPLEFLAGDSADLGPRSDYFTFASLFYRFLMGISQPVWRNAEADPTAATGTYLETYDQCIDQVRARLTDVGAGDEASAFIVMALHPIPARRPRRMPRHFGT